MVKFSIYLNRRVFVMSKTLKLMPNTELMEDSIIRSNVVNKDIKITFICDHVMNGFVIVIKKK